MALRGSSRLLTSALVVSLCLSGMAALVPMAHAESTTVNVVINNYSFSPASITVVIGVNNTVTWTNEQTGGVVHTVTSDDGTWSSTDLSNGQTFTHTFTATGTFGYHCSIHTYMKGTVVVLSAGSTSTTTTTTTQPTTTTSTVAPTTTTTTTSGGVPEFPFSALAVVAITALVLSSYLMMRRSSRPAPLGGPVPA